MDSLQFAILVIIQQVSLPRGQIQHADLEIFQSKNLSCNTISGSDNTVYVTLGSQSVLPCPLSSVINNTKWIGPPGNTFYNLEGTNILNVAALPADFVSRLAVNTTTGALLINNTQWSDGNVYRCEIRGNVSRVILTILVTPQPPFIANTLEDNGLGKLVVRAKEENRVSLVCQIMGGNPQPSVKRIRGGVTVSEVLANNSVKSNTNGTYDVISTLTIMANRSEDRVTYVCQAEHRTWTSPHNASLELYLYLKPRYPVLSEQGSLQEGGNISVKCSVNECRPLANLTWTGPQGQQIQTHTWIPEDETYNVTSLYTKTVIRQDNGVIVQCIVTHIALGSSLTASKTVMVWFPPTNVNITGNREVTAGQDTLILGCTTGTSNPIADISWSNGTNTLDGQLSTKMKLPGDYNGKIQCQNLTITPTRYMDGNSITCSAQNFQTSGPSVSDNVILNVKYNPITVISNGSPLSVKEWDTNLTLVCTAESKPVSSFIWVKDNVTLKTTGPKSNNQDTYTLSQVNRTHYGQYSCIANNGISPNGQGNVSLHVMFLPSNLSITNNKEVTAGQGTLILICTTGTSNPVANISWRNGTSAPIGELSTKIEQPGAYGGIIQNQNLTITPTRYMDGSIIICSAHNSQTTGPSVSDSVILNIKYNPITVISNGSPLSVKEGDTNLTLVCTAESKPVSSFIWVKDNVILKTTGPMSDNRDTYTISQVNRTHYGQYSCIADNGISPNGQENVSLHVMFLPSNLSITNNKEVTAGQDTLILICTTGTSNPVANISWRNGTSAPIGELSTKIEQPGAYGGIIQNQNLTITPTRYMDGSIIICSAHNSQTIGPSVSDSVILNIKFSPIVQVSLIPNMNVTEGSPVTIRCSASSKPISYFTLRKEGLSTAISEGAGSQDNHHDYVIQKINRTDAGRFSCSANNGVVGHPHQVNATLELVVQYPPDITISTRNITTSDVQARLVCLPRGVPDRYTFGTWQHRWPGYNTTLRSLSSTYVDEHNAILDLKSLSYQDSGFYMCQASNGVRADGTQNDVIAQMEYVLVKAPPVILKIPKDIEGAIGGFVAIQLDYYSNTEAGNVTLQHSNSSKVYQAETVYEIYIYNLQVQLHHVSAKGFRGNFSISINEEGDFGKYIVNVRNSIGFIVSTLEIKPKGLVVPPTAGPQISAIVGGAVGGSVVVLALVVVLILFLRRWTSSSEKNMHREPIQRERPESGLVENPVYDSSGPLPGPSTGIVGVECALVVKPKKTAAQLEDPSNLYAKVDKKNKKQMKGLAKVKQVKISRGDIYENVDLTRNITNLDNVDENSGHVGTQAPGDNVYENPGTATFNRPLENKEGLLYADLMLDPPTTKNGKPVIRGIENRTEYAEIAYGRRGKPLLDSDDEQKKIVGEKKDE